jgi:hypothetical protein
VASTAVPQPGGESKRAHTMSIDWPELLILTAVILVGIVIARRFRRQ